MICDACLRLTQRPAPATPTCEAFPLGIPSAILDGFDHRRSFPGDRGIRFVFDPAAGEILRRFDADNRWRTE